MTVNTVVHITGISNCLLCLLETLCLLAQSVQDFLRDVRGTLVAKQGSSELEMLGPMYKLMIRSIIRMETYLQEHFSDISDKDKPMLTIRRQN